MHATDILTREHRVIEQVLDCLESVADQATLTGTMDWVAAQQVVDFCRQFVDQAHHGKEDSFLFPLLARKGLSRQYGPTGVMVCEHHHARRHIRGMARAIQDAADAVPEARQLFLGHARAYVYLLRQHIAKEDHCLFPWVDRMFSEDERQFLADAFATAAQAEQECGTSERCLRLARDLADRFHVPCESVEAAAAREPGE